MAFFRSYFSTLSFWLSVKRNLPIRPSFGSDYRELLLFSMVMVLFDTERDRLELLSFSFC